MATANKIEKTKASLETLLQELAEQPPPNVKLEMSKDHKLDIKFAGTWDCLVAASGNISVFNGVVSQSACLGSTTEELDSHTTNFVLGFVHAMEPKDAAETLLLTQMAATHQATMSLAKALNRNKMLAQQEVATKGLNKLARTFTAQMETLKRYRSKGKQIVRVERVNVLEGGQAIVGEVKTGGGNNEK